MALAQLTELRDQIIALENTLGDPVTSAIQAKEQTTGQSVDGSQPHVTQAEPVIDATTNSSDNNANTSGEEEQETDKALGKSIIQEPGQHEQVERQVDQNQEIFKEHARLLEAMGERREIAQQKSQALKQQGDSAVGIAQNQIQEMQSQLTARQAGQHIEQHKVEQTKHEAEKPKFLEKERTEVAEILMGVKFEEGTEKGAQATKMAGQIGDIRAMMASAGMGSSFATANVDRGQTLGTGASPGNDTAIEPAVGQQQTAAMMHTHG